MATVVSQAMRFSGTGIWWRTPVTAALTPDQAAAYVRELSADVRAVVVLAADGRLLAGPAPLAAPVRALLAAAGDAPDAAVRTPGGVVLAARTADAAVVAVAGPLSLLGPTGLDVRTAVEALAPPAPPPAAEPSEDRAPRPATLPPTPPPSTLSTAAEVVISATQRAI